MIQRQLNVLILNKDDLIYPEGYVKNKKFKFNGLKPSVNREILKSDLVVFNGQIIKSRYTNI